MFIRVKKNKSKKYFYLVENQRLDGKHRQRVVAYLGNRQSALAALEAMDIPNKEKLIARVRGATPAPGKSQNKRLPPTRKAAEKRLELDVGGGLVEPPRLTNSYKDVVAIMPVLRFLFEILEASAANNHRGFQEEGWRESIKLAVELLKQHNADEVMGVLLPLEMSMVSDLLQNPLDLEKFLRLRQQAETKASHQLSCKQQGILIKLFLETNEGFGRISWAPQVWFNATTSSDRASLSASLKRLESRALVVLHPLNQTSESRRAALVELTELGRSIATRLTKLYFFLNHSSA